jgi:hypothetical protein
VRYFIVTHFPYQSADGGCVRDNLIPALYPILDELQGTLTNTHPFCVTLSEGEDHLDYRLFLSEYLNIRNKEGLIPDLVGLFPDLISVPTPAPTGGDTIPHEQPPSLMTIMILFSPVTMINNDRSLIAT